MTVVEPNAEPDAAELQGHLKKDPDAASVPYPSEPYAWYVVVVLLLMYINSFLDRQIIALLVGPIQRDLNIGDFEVSLLMGFAFAIFYTILGIPIGRAADRHSRRWIIYIGVSFWSIAATSCGLAKNYWQLFLARVGVGVGEAALSPSAYSLIADYFPKNKLGRALSIYGMGVTIGSGLAFLLGGWVIDLVSDAEAWTLPVVGEIRPWQMVFIVTGAPGLLLALLMFTVKEPVRRGMMKREGHASAFIPLGEVIAFILARWRTYGAHFGAFSLYAVIGYGIGAWAPAYMIRVFEWSPGDVGLAKGLVIGIFGTAGLVGAGFLADWMMKRGIRDTHFRLAMYCGIVTAPAGVIAFLVPNPWVMLTFLAIINLTNVVFVGIAAAALQMITPNQMRGQVSAVYLFCINFVGLGLGPSIIAAITDFGFGDQDMVGYSLAITVGFCAPIAALILWTGLKPYQACLEEAEARGG